jgi:hypothetical protein
VPWVAQQYGGGWAWRIRTIPVRQALRLEPEESFLARRLPGYVTARMVEDNVPRGAKVLTFGQLPEAYSTRDILVGYQAAFNNLLTDILQTPLIPEFQPTWRLAFRFPAQPIQRVRLVQTAREQYPWSITEVRAVHGGHELERAPWWRLRARPYPTGVQLAFDNSPVTRWRSWEHTRPGMFVEVDFGREETLEAILVDCSPDHQLQARLRLEVQERSGQWRVLVAEPEVGELPPALGLRREATRELRAQGVAYLVVLDGDFGARDFRDNASLWGLKLLGERGPTALYQILP